MIAVDALDSISMFLPTYASFTCAARSWLTEPLVTEELSTERFQTGLPLSRAVVAGPVCVKDPAEILAVTEASKTFMSTITKDCN